MGAFTIVERTLAWVLIFAVWTLYGAITQLLKRDTPSPITDAIHLRIFVARSHCRLWLVCGVSCWLRWTWFHYVYRHVKTHTLI